MTESTPSTRADARGVLDPGWEDELRRGQEAEGEAGSIDAELAFVHLLRHARAPETLDADQLDAIWSDIDAELSPEGEPWWRKAWVWWTAPALAAAAVLFVVVVDPGAQSAAPVAQGDLAQSESAPQLAQAEAEAEAEEKTAPADEAQLDSRRSLALDKNEPEGEAAGEAKAAGAGKESKSAQGSAAETYFRQLAPSGRRSIRVSVDQSRDALRAQLLDTARGGG